MHPVDANTQQHTVTVTESGAGQRIDRFLAEALPDVSRAQVQRAVEAGAVFVDDRPVKSNYKLHDGETIAITLVRPPSEEAPPVPEDIALDIVYEDEQIIVINKEAGMVVHPAAGHRTGTIVNALLGRGAFGDPDAVGTPGRPGIVHRLDKGTSGLLVVARTESAHRHLAVQLKNRTLTRLYWAVSWGRLKNEELCIDKPVGRSTSDRKRMAVTRRGRSARTTVRVLERFELAELIEARLETGRTHQIRVHLTNAGHPIVGDSDYGGGMARLKGIDPRRRLHGRRMIEAIGRPALHARTLALDHPATGERMEWTVETPADFTALLSTCRGESDPA